MTTLPSGKSLQTEHPNELSDRVKLQTVRAHLDLIMSQIDYTRGACYTDSKIASLIRPEYLEAVRTALELTK